MNRTRSSSSKIAWWGSRQQPRNTTPHSSRHLTMVQCSRAPPAAQRCCQAGAFKLLWRFGVPSAHSSPAFPANSIRLPISPRPYKLLPEQPWTHLRAVAVVHVKVHDGHPADLVVRKRVVGCDCHVVEDAVAAAVAALSMVPRGPAAAARTGHTAWCHIHAQQQHARLAQTGVQALAGTTRTRH